ncbi:hypothetical protein AOG2_07270 [Geobacter sp. AOG2]|nr:hypothetical protein AOG2_07270 [Geobacter sp. AOG2]
MEGIFGEMVMSRGPMAGLGFTFLAFFTYRLYYPVKSA